MTDVDGLRTQGNRTAEFPPFPLYVGAAEGIAFFYGAFVHSRL